MSASCVILLNFLVIFGAVLCQISTSNAVKDNNSDEDADLSLCVKQRNEALSASQKLVGVFIPQCDEKGNFMPKQCHGSTGYCWCVDKNGKKIDQTEKGPGQDLKCEDPDLSLCVKQRNEALSASQKLVGVFIPQCDEKGNFMPKQCHGSTGYCWCVDKNGKKIDQTEKGPGQDLKCDQNYKGSF